MTDIPREFVFTRYPGKQGSAWLRMAYHMFSRHRGPWVVIVVGYIAALLVVAFLPYIGMFAVMAMKPVFAVGLLAAAWQQERGGVPHLSHLFQGFRANLRALLVIGVFVVAGITVAVLASSLVDDGRLLEFIAARGSLADEAAKARGDHLLLAGMLLAALLSLPVVVAAWWAPALIVFQDATATAALGASLRAAMANWKALVVYGLLVYFYAGVVPWIWYAITAVLIPDPALSLVVKVPMIVYTLCLAATLHIADYVSYRDVFHANETLAPLSRSGS
jgi:hypothetical protein